MARHTRRSDIAMVSRTSATICPHLTGLDTFRGATSRRWRCPMTNPPPTASIRHFPGVVPVIAVSNRSSSLYKPRPTDHRSDLLPQLPYTWSGPFALAKKYYCLSQPADDLVGCNGLLGNGYPPFPQYIPLLGSDSLFQVASVLGDQVTISIDPVSKIRLTLAYEAFDRLIQIDKGAASTH